MTIILDKSANVFTLQSKHSTYQMKVGKLGNLLHTYYGARLSAQDLSYLLFDGENHFAPYPSEFSNRRGSLDILSQEFPTAGTGDLRSLGLLLENADGSRVLDLRFVEVKLLPGKYALESLPAFFAASDDEKVESLEITLRDELSQVEIQLLYAVFEDKDVITRALRVKNLGEQAVRIKKAQSLVLDFHSGDFDLIHFQGRWAMERQFERQALTHSTTSFGSNYGVSGNRQNPGFLLADKATTEDFGDCYGFNLLYSGNWTATAEKSSLGQNRVTLGLGDADFSWQLLPGESFEAPEALLSFSNQGFTGLSHNFHDMVRENLCLSKYSRTARPVLLNNWEATYFDFDGEKLLEIAASAKEIGADLLVLDDGWFGNRFDDNRALGDWHVNEEKLGMSMGELARRVNEAGLKFGIWFEPEMVSEDSDLYRLHPDWTLNFPDRKPLLGRNQLNLDLSKKLVRVYLFEVISKLLDSAEISYLKWDMNRPISDWYSSGLDREHQGELQHRYVLGLYELLSSLTTRYPDVLFEGCASSGARFDLGMLVYQPQIWTSDNTDAVNRLKIQYGTSFFYPLSTMGAHVSAVPNHQTGRETPLETRANVAMAGSYGYELDPTKLTEAEKAQTLVLTERYKDYQELIFSGDYYRLSSPFDSELTAWQIVAKDLSESLLTLVATNAEGNPPFNYLKLKGLDATALYEVEDHKYFGSVLMNAGLRLAQSRADYSSQQIYIRKVDKDG
ncbi:MAG: alpha-galactosidase [Streptococcaceae bacterium]|jgi:alpha-galactosidase|nr:alpha-galactosidase [Streptococcaceae bacterium]